VVSCLLRSPSRYGRRRRIAAAIRAGQAAGRNGGKNKFDSHQERNGFLVRLVGDYHRTRLKCLAYKAPLEALNNPQGIGH
jgi:hypothetical protein